MAESTQSLPGIGVVVGLVFGAALGTTTAVLLSVPTASVTGFSTGGGLVVGAGAGRLAEVNRGKANLAIRVLGGSAFFGVVIGVGIGAVAAWTADASLPTGAVIGVLVGVVHGAGVGGVLLATIRRRDTGDVAF